MIKFTINETHTHTHIISFIMQTQPEIIVDYSIEDCERYFKYPIKTYTIMPMASNASIYIDNETYNLKSVYSQTTKNGELLVMLYDNYIKLIHYEGILTCTICKQQFKKTDLNLHNQCNQNEEDTFDTFIAKTMIRLPIQYEDAFDKLIDKAKNTPIYDIQTFYREIENELHNLPVSKKQKI